MVQYTKIIVASALLAAVPAFAAPVLRSSQSIQAREELYRRCPNGNCTGGHGHSADRRGPDDQTHRVNPAPVVVPGAPGRRGPNIGSDGKETARQGNAPKRRPLVRTRELEELLERAIQARELGLLVLNARQAEFEELSARGPTGKHSASSLEVPTVDTSPAKNRAADEKPQRQRKYENSNTLPVPGFPFADGLRHPRDLANFYDLD